ncbi:FAD/NAD(P)-binding protein [Photobacterium sp. CCB-ST2H9]|uniref:FAD/NAD(P)-binding protein n=1 Tax=Photobacterium sp. CCB-ST2H9 TaxID=2912855 RepID=UPI0020065A3A|nr:FAD/NAD(P)-binding protein [Photobacterium sp. CCB-ST2H9]UTM60309.1 FAD/NAD(P)-binding protein [Photobacterium sp. CCB-ST2H9]
MMKRITLTLVGGGASSLAFLDAFTRHWNVVQNQDVVIFVMEKKSVWGVGNAYAEDSHSNLLNTQAGLISGIPGQPGDFMHWLKAHPLKWQPDFPELNIDASTYAPRALFGRYMQDRFFRVIRQAAEKNIFIVTVAASVTSICADDDSTRYIVSTECGHQLPSDAVILACGTHTKVMDSAQQQGKIFSSPYPVRSVTRAINEHDNVVVFGARLSAIDIVVGLIERGHKGKIQLRSRGGFFPSVRGTQGTYRNQFLSPGYIEQNFETLSLAHLAQLFHLELSHYRKNYEDTPESLQFPTPPVTDFRHYLRKEIALADGPRGWQAILYSANTALDIIRRKLAEEDKRRFFAESWSNAMALRVSIPKENAEKLLAAVESGQLSYQTGPDSKVADSPADVVVYATGNARDLTQADSPLLHHMFASGLAVSHPHGGLQILNETYQVLDHRGFAHPKIFALGEITNGNFLFTSALDLIVEHGSRCAISVIAALTQSEPPTEDSPWEHEVGNEVR